MDKDLSIRTEVASHGFTTAVIIAAKDSEYGARDRASLAALECVRRNQESARGFLTRKQAPVLFDDNCEVCRDGV